MRLSLLKRLFILALFLLGGFNGPKKTPGRSQGFWSLDEGAEAPSKGEGQMTLGGFARS